MKKNSIQAWIAASRPKTLAGAAAPVIVGGSLAWHDGYQDAYKKAQELAANNVCSQDLANQHIVLFSIPFLLCLLFALMMQIDANLVNDYFDCKKGTDREDRLGPARACAQGWISPKSMITGIAICTLLSCVIGLTIFMWNIQWELILVGLACVAGCFLYTTKFSYLGLGDLLVLVFFGIVPVGFTYYVITRGEWTTPLLLAGLGTGLATDTLLMVNNYRDRNQDLISGKKTLVVRFGGKFGLASYLTLGIAAAALGVAACVIIDKPVHSLLIIIYLLLHTATWLKLRETDGKELNAFLGKTSRNILLYGLVLTLCFAL